MSVGIPEGGGGKELCLASLTVGPTLGLGGLELLLAGRPLSLRALAHSPVEYQLFLVPRLVVRHQIHRVLVSYLDIFLLFLVILFIVCLVFFLVVLIFIIVQ
jgi:hypothetical protein